jgi:CRISPR-associated protein Cmx8
MSETLKLHWDLFSLPTAQHRAGLAGLLLVLDLMRRTVGTESVPEAEGVQSGTVQLTLTRDALQQVLNYLYDATTEEQPFPALRKSRDGEIVPPLRVEEVSITDAKSGKEKLQKRYIYPQIVPRAPFLRAMGTPEPWIKLWRDAVWSTLRGIPRTRIPYEQRAAGEPVAEAPKLWAELEHAQKPAKDRLPVAVRLPSIFVGAEGESAEQVPFTGTPAENLLLLFWPVVMGVGEARQVAIGSDGRVEEGTAGFVLAVPDVADLEGFIHEFEAWNNRLDGQAMHGYRPRDAVFALPAEGALQYLDRLAAIARGRLAGGEVRFTVSGVEVYLLQKRVNTIPVLASTRVAADRKLVERYAAQIRDCRDLLARAQLVRNLLDRRPWYAGFDRLFNAIDARLVLGSSGWRFAVAVGERFRTELG